MHSPGRHLLKVVVFIEQPDNGYRAVAFLPPFIGQDFNDTVRAESPLVSKDVFETLRALLDFPLWTSYRPLLTCLRCGNSESRDYAVDLETGICEWCNLPEAERNYIAERERAAEEYVYGPLNDYEYPPDTLTIG